MGLSYDCLMKIVSYCKLYKHIPIAGFTIKNSSMKWYGISMQGWQKQPGRKNFFWMFVYNY